MTATRLVPLTLLLSLLPQAARAYEGAVERVEERVEIKQPVLTRAPELISFAEAPYPEEAREAGLTGEVGLLVDIGPDGRVAGVEVIRPAGHGFDEAAAEAVRKFVFTPAELDGVPAAVRIEYVYKFVLSEAPPPPPAPEPALGPVTLRGQVIERGSREPIVGATVRCVGLDETATTDAEGRFELRPPVGACQVEVSATNHLPLQRTEQIEQGKQLEVTYHLMPRSYGLFETIVRGERDRREATQRTLARDEMQKVPGTMGDPVRVLQSMPGVARAPYLSGQLIVRGAAPSETGCYMDSVQIPLLFHFLGGPSVINGEFLDRLDFLPGGFGPRYGRATGGIVDAYTRRGSNERWHGSFKIDMVDSALFAEAPVGESTSVAVAARRSYVDLLLPLVMPDDPQNGSISVLPRYWDYQVRADHGKASDRHQLTVMAFGSDDDLAVAATGGQRDRNLELGANTNFHRLRLGWTWREGALSNTLSPYFGRDAVGAGASSEETETFAVRGDSLIGGLRDEVALELPGGHKARLGLDLGYANTDVTAEIPAIPDYRMFPGSYPAQQPEHFERSLETLSFGTYNEWEVKLGERLTLLPGLRLDHHRIYGHGWWGFDPRFNARLKLTERATLKGAVGHYTGAPAADQVDPEVGNPDLDLAKAFQSALGFELKLTDVVSVDMSGFYNRRYDEVVWTNDVKVLEDGTRKPLYYENTGLGRAYGVELLLRHEITEHFFGWLAYTFSRTESRRVGEQPYVVTTYDQTHILALVSQYRIGNGWAASGRFRLVSGMPVTPVVGATFDADSDTYSSIRGERLSARKPLFHQLDLRVDKEWLFDDWRLGVYLDVQNVYWAKNVEYYMWDYRYRQVEEIPGLPILPTLGIKGSF